MTQLEIATQIFCSKPDLSYEEAYHVAGLLIGLDKEINHNDEDIKIIQDPANESINNLKLINLSQRTAERTQQLIDLGFEWNEPNNCFEKDHDLISTNAIEILCDEDWNAELEKVLDEGNYDESILPIILPKENIPNGTIYQEGYDDFFKGNPYIEFEMPNTTLRLYRMDKQQEAENDLQVTKKTESKYIMTHSENKEFELGITIFKK